MHCLKGVQIQSFSGLCFLAFRLNTEIYCQFEYGKIWTRKTLNSDIFNAVVSETLNLSGSTICPSIYCMFMLTGQYTRSPMVDHFHQVYSQFSRHCLMHDSYPKDCRRVVLDSASSVTRLTQDTN